jgi:hypothetical protein
VAIRSDAKEARFRAGGWFSVRNELSRTKTDRGSRFESGRTPNRPINATAVAGPHTEKTGLFICVGFQARPYSPHLAMQANSIKSCSSVLFRKSGGDVFPENELKMTTARVVRILPEHQHPISINSLSIRTI